MRVLVVDTANQTPFYDYALCEALAAAGCQVSLLTAPYLDGEPPALGVPMGEWFGRVAGWPILHRSQPLRRVARAVEYPVDWALTLKHIRSARPDIVHVQWAMLPPFDSLAFRAVQRLGPRLVYTVHDVRPHEHWRQAWLPTKSLLRLPDDLIVHTTTNKRELTRLAGISDTKVHVIPHGNLIDYSGPPLPRDVARAQLGLATNSPIMLFFGMIKPYKGLDRLIEALPLVLERLPTARLLIAGYPAEPFKRYRQSIERLGLRNRVDVHLGFVPHREVSRYFCAADVVAVSYLATTFSGVLMAAYGFGRPVVATDTGGLREAVEVGETGYVVPPYDPEALADGLVRVLADADEATRMGRRARELALGKYAWPGIAQATLQVYRGSSLPQSGRPRQQYLRSR